MNLLIFAEYEHIINNLDSLLEVSLVDTYYDIKLTCTLVEHLYVDVCE